MNDSAWLRLIIINAKYTMKNLSLILKRYIFQPEDALCVKRCLVVLAILENIYFLSMRLRFFIVYFLFI